LIFSQPFLYKNSQLYLNNGGCYLLRLPLLLYFNKLAKYLLIIIYFVYNMISYMDELQESFNAFVPISKDELSS